MLYNLLDCVMVRRRVVRRAHSLIPNSSRLNIHTDNDGIIKKVKHG